MNKTQRMVKSNRTADKERLVDAMPTEEMVPEKKILEYAEELPSGNYEIDFNGLARVKVSVDAKKRASVIRGKDKAFDSDENKVMIAICKAEDGSYLVFLYAHGQFMWLKDSNELPPPTTLEEALKYAVAAVMFLDEKGWSGICDGIQSEDKRLEALKREGVRLYPKDKSGKYDNCCQEDKPIATFFCKDLGFPICLYLLDKSKDNVDVGMKCADDGQIEHFDVRLPSLKSMGTSGKKLLITIRMLFFTSSVKLTVEKEHLYATKILESLKSYLSQHDTDIPSEL